jgi:hypothetical protein
MAALLAGFSAYLLRDGAGPGRRLRRLSAGHPLASPDELAEMIDAGLGSLASTAGRQPAPGRAQLIVHGARMSTVIGALR